MFPTIKKEVLSLVKIISNRKGSAVVEIVMCLTLITFILFFPLALFSFTSRQTAMSTLLIHSMQIVSLEGGLTPSADSLIRDNAQRLGMIPEDVLIFTIPAPPARVTKDALNPRIALRLQYPADHEVRFLNAVGAMIVLEVIDENNYYTLTGYVHSEWIGH